MAENIVFLSAIRNKDVIWNIYKYGFKILKLMRINNAAF